jgi:circadian clock protein KaiB
MKRPSNYRLRLYIANGALNGSQAIANINSICRVYLPYRFELEIVDVIKEPKRALEDSIFMTPTLVKLSPGPVKRIVGTLSNEATVVLALGLEHRVAGPPGSVSDSA